jgi:hypothetical protein
MVDPLPLARLLAAARTSHSVAQTLEKRGYIEIFSQEVLVTRSLTSARQRGS